MSKFAVLDLFSGVGGFSLGLERTGGFETVAFCEIDPFCRRVLAKHWPKVPCYDDVRTLSASALCRDGIAIDVICGGFPCQDISVAGAGAGIDGERSGLWSEFARLIGELRPRFVIIENVSALLSGRDEYILPTDRCLCGWPYRWRGLPVGTEQGWPVVHAALRHGDVGEGAAGSEDAANPVWRQSWIASEGDEEMGSGVALGDQWQAMPDHAGGSRTSPPIEVGAGQTIAGNGQLNGADHQGAGFGTEPEGAERDAGGRLVCPSCGRPVADSATRSGVGTWMGRILADLAALGFDAEWHCIPAAAVGAPHRRDRLWIVAYPGGEQHQGDSVADQWPGAPQFSQAFLANASGDQLRQQSRRRGRQSGAGAAFAGEHGQTRSMADADRDAGQQGRPGDAAQGPQWWDADRGGIGADVADADHQGKLQQGQPLSEERRWPSDGSEELADASQSRLPPSERDILLRARWWHEGRATAECGWWAAEPDVGRVAHGVPARVDRLRSLGNAVVPQIPELIGRAILEALA